MLMPENELLYDYSTPLDGRLIGRRVRAIRERQELSRDQLGLLVAQKNNLEKGLTGSYIYRLETGKHAHPQWRTIELLARALGVSPIDLIAQPKAVQESTDTTMQNHDETTQEELKSLLHQLMPAQDADLLYSVIQNMLKTNPQGRELVAIYAEMAQERFKRNNHSKGNLHAVDQGET